MCQLFFLIFVRWLQLHASYSPRKLPNWEGGGEREGMRSVLVSLLSMKKFFLEESILSCWPEPGLNPQILQGLADHRCLINICWMDVSLAKGNGIITIILWGLELCVIFLSSGQRLYDLSLLIFPKWGSRFSSRCGRADTGASSPWFLRLLSLICTLKDSGMKSAPWLS